ncbi:RmlC-like cupins superfamily protein [Striga hermonthica]|uniref:RmlC-like cupins superfamily protein n=1 Tax=Striga hermonthica TaxID=68872 RepID=A0A9N7NBU1_STRHE|nr:RmlC-like cupins superfamily protein [Striga hermonthica]
MFRGGRLVGCGRGFRLEILTPSSQATLSSTRPPATSISVSRLLPSAHIRCRRFLIAPSFSPSSNHHCTTQAGSSVCGLQQLPRLKSPRFELREVETMELDLTPKLAKKIYGGDGGAYYAWCPDELPMLREGNIGAAKLALEKNGFAPPRYSDSAKVAYVLQGSGMAGIVLPEKEEKVLPIKKGDAIALPFGVVTWYINKDDQELVILFLGDTSKAHKRGSFTDFFLTGPKGIFTGFSTEFVTRAWDVDELTAKALVSSQPTHGIVKLGPNAKFPEPKKDHYKGMALNCEEAPLDVDIKGGGKVVVLNTKNLPLVGEVGLGADLVGLNGGAMCSPGFSCDSALQVTYIVRGSGRVQVVGVDGKRVLETTIKAGNLFIVPRFFVVSKIADPDGMDWFSIITTPDPIFTHLAGRTSVWKALSSEVLQAAFNVPADVEQKFSSKRKAEEIFFPPPN